VLALRQAFQKNMSQMTRIQSLGPRKTFLRRVREKGLCSWVWPALSSLSLARASSCSDKKTDLEFEGVPGQTQKPMIPRGRVITALMMNILVVSQHCYTVRERLIMSGSSANVPAPSG